MRRAAVLLLLLGCDGSSSFPLDASVDGAASKDAASDAAKDATSDACFQPSPEGCGEPCPGSFFPQPLVVPTARSVCTAKQIDDLWMTCLDASADKTACLALLKANDPCTTCLWTSEAKPPWGALVEDAANLLRTNLSGCLAVTSADPSCGDGAELMRQCDAYYCATVCAPYDPSPPFPQYAVCHSHARNGFCASFAAKDCAPADAGPTAQCAGNDFHASYVAVATVLCAAPVKDAGGD